ncbi:MAG TPA: chloride channel protein [Anaeromyxobacteraceae bacterium]|nr:chloride channel protein [Anaeromyxobacteraceae bacterium]
MSFIEHELVSAKIEIVDEQLASDPGAGTGLRLFRSLRGRLQRLRVAVTERHKLFVLTLLIGGLCGLAAVAFHLTINLVTRLAIDPAMAAPGHAWIPWTLVVPTMGGLASGVLLRYVVPNARGSGIPQVKVAYAGRSGPLRVRDSIGKFFIAALQIGTGSSLGREGPTVQICAGIASRVGRLAGVSPQDVRRLLPVGAAAGIAAAFNAPIAAVTFTIEEVVGNLDQTVLSGVVVAAAFAAIVERSVLGAHPIFEVPRPYGLEHVSSLLLYAALGLVAAGLALLFTESLLGLRKRFKGARHSWAHPAVGGLATGLLAVAAMGTMGASGVTGGGYATLGTALAGKLAVAVLVPLCLMKIAATVFSYSSGGAGGIFAPALFIGAMAGGAVGALDMALLHHSADSLGAFALVGMGAVFAGIIRAPITSVLIIVEMTGGYSLILPLMIANMLAYGIARHYRPTPIYEALLEQDGVRLHERTLADELEGVTLRQVPLDTAPYLTFGRADGIDDLLGGLSNRTRQEVFPVLDGSRLVGIITLEDLVSLAGQPHLDGLANAADVMRPPIALSQDDQVRVAFETMLAQGVRELPVTDAGGAIIGFVDETSMAHAYIAARNRRT